ncbi:MAG: hypothetical protein NTW86_08915 [Candidatus Sumerlaeota bacterium]|nr:hypothetical protein [Candidatus Sumerlaeota bacterium]
MPEFSYRAVGDDWSIHKGNVQASCRQSAVMRVEKLGLHPLDLGPSKNDKSRKTAGAARASLWKRIVARVAKRRN